MNTVTHLILPSFLIIVILGIANNGQTLAAFVLGAELGALLGAELGALLGALLGAKVGGNEGNNEGLVLMLGNPLGAIEEVMLGDMLGFELIEGAADGCIDGTVQSPQT